MDRHVNSTMIGVRVSWEMHDLLKQMAEERGISMNGLMKAMINTVLYQLAQEEQR